MIKVVREAPWVPACLGILAGAGLGHVAGGVAIACVLVALLVPLAHERATPRAAARRMGTFAAAWCLSGLWPFASGVPAALGALVWAPIALLVLLQGAIMGLLVALAWRAVGSSASRMLLVLPAAWVLHEYLLGLGQWAVPWVRLGHGFGGEGPFAGLLPWGGVLLAGGFAVSTCGALALAWHRRGTLAAWRLAALSGTMVVAAAFAGKVPWTSPTAPIAVTLAQPGERARSDAHGDEQAVHEALAFYRQAARDTASGVLVTPELALPRTLDAIPASYFAELDATLAPRGVDALIGLHFESGAASPGFHNGVLGLGVSGAQRYLKSRLIPFGESNPLGDALRNRIAAWRGSTFGMTVPADGEGDALVVAGHRAAIALCYEIAFGDSLRRRAASADLLVVMTSDSAVDSPRLVQQAVQVARTRARELGKPMLRVSDVDGTLVIDADGSVLERAPAHARALLRAQVQPRAGLTPYGRFGDAIALSAALLALCAGALTTRRVAHRDTPAGRAGARLRPLRGAGQVLPAAVGLLVVMGGVFYLMVNSGQTVTEKIRVTNAADAAAYSAGIVEARALNYDAYMNRAIVANEIAIAQMVSLASWLDYFATGADNYGANLTQVNLFVLPDPKVLVLDAAFLGTNYISAYTGMTAQEYADYIIEYGLAPIITLHNGVAEALSLSQAAVRLNLTAGVRQQQIANDVVKAMDPALSAEVVLVTHGFDTFTKSYARSGGSGDERGRLADVVTRSRDPFTRERNWTARGIDIPFFKKDGALKKRGGTELIGYDEWRAVDTLELHGRTFGCGKTGLSWCDDIRTPVGWGATEVDAGGGDAGRGYHGNAYGENSTTANRAETYMRRPTYAYFTGIPDSMELRDLDPKADISSGVTIRVSKDQAAMLTSGGAAQAKPSGAMAQFNDKPAGGKMMALSRAQVFFDRIAARADGKQEIGSLYNPYWRVRLVAPTAADKAYAATKQGGMMLP